MKLFTNPLVLHLGHAIWVGSTWRMGAVENLLGSAMVLCWKAIDCQLYGVLSSSEDLKLNQHHTGLQCDWLVPALHGVAGSKEMGMLKFSLPLSYPSSSNASLLSNAALSVITK